MEKCRAQCKEPTYEDLIVFDRPTHEVEDEIKAVEKMNQPGQYLQMYVNDFLIGSDLNENNTTNGGWLSY